MTRLEKAEKMLDYVYPMYKILESLDASCRRTIIEETGGYRGDGANDPENKSYGWKRVKSWEEISATLNKNLYKLHSQEDELDMLPKIDELLEMLQNIDKPENSEESCENCPDKEHCMMAKKQFEPGMFREISLEELIHILYFGRLPK